MTLQNLDGGFTVPIGPGLNANVAGPNTTNTMIMDAAGEAVYFIGHIITSDRGSHTIDTTGSSKLEWHSGTITFANAGSTVKVGLAALDLANGPPGRPAKSAGLVTFDVSKSLIGGGGGIPANSGQSHVPDTGTKTIANGDLVCFAIELTTLGGADIVRATYMGNGTTENDPHVTSFVNGAMSANSGLPNCFITFSDGATGWFYGTEIGAFGTVAYNSSSSPNEYGQLFKLPFPVRLFGAWCFVTPAAEFDICLYTDPLGTPVSQRSVSVDRHWVNTASVRRMHMPFTSPYDIAADQQFAIVLKPTTTTNITIFTKVFDQAVHRISDHVGVDGYGVNRSSGAFANANSSLTHYLLGPLVGGFNLDTVMPTYQLGM